jgi:serine protease Do
MLALSIPAAKISRMFCRLVILSGLSLLSCHAWSQEPAPLPRASFGALADRTFPGLVAIQRPGYRGVPGSPTAAVGAGFIVSKDGLILTTRQTIGEAPMADVVMLTESGPRVLPARVISGDSTTGAILLKVDASDLQPLPLGDSTGIRAGDPIFIGVARDGHRSFVEGRLEGRSFRRERRGMSGEVLETDIAVSPASAGSPLLDGAGNVIGITLISPPSQREPAGFALPLNPIRPMIEDALRPAAAETPPPPAGAMPPAPGGGRAFLGIQIAERPPAPTPPGVPAGDGTVVVQLVGAGSPAEAAGLRSGDAIISVNGEPVRDAASLRQFMATRVPGDELTLEIVRDGHPQSVKVVLAALPAETGAAAVPPPAPPGLPAAIMPPDYPPTVQAPAPAPGLTINALTPEVRARTSVPPEVNGVVVTYISPTSRALTMGLQEGDVITQVNRKAVTSPDQALALVRGGDKTVLVKVYRKGDTMLFMVGQ